MSMETLTNEIKELRQRLHTPVPNPAPLGLFAFGLTTALLNLKHSRIIGSSQSDAVGTENLVWGFAIFYGGLLQLIAGLGEIRRNNIFGYTAFISYGGFWMSLGLAQILNKFYPDESGRGFTDGAIQGMLILMGFFTFVMWICTLAMNKTISLLFILLTLTFFLLAGGVHHNTVDIAAGWFGIFTSAVAYWLAAVEIINDIIGHGKEMIPLGRFHWNKYPFRGVFHVPGRIHGHTHEDIHIATTDSKASPLPVHAGNGSLPLDG